MMACCLIYNRIGMIIGVYLNTGPSSLHRLWYTLNDFIAVPFCHSIIFVISLTRLCPHILIEMHTP